MTGSYFWMIAQTRNNEKRVRQLLITAVIFLSILKPSHGAADSAEGSRNTNPVYTHIENGCSLDLDDQIHAPSFVKLYRDSEIVAEGDVRTSRLPFSEIKWQSQPETFSSNVDIEYELRRDTNGNQNFVFFSFNSFDANGFIILSDIQNNSKIKAYFIDQNTNKKELLIKYFEPQSLKDLLLDLSCAIRKLRFAT